MTCYVILDMKMAMISWYLSLKRNIKPDRHKIICFLGFVFYFVYHDLFFLNLSHLLHLYGVYLVKFIPVMVKLLSSLQQFYGHLWYIYYVKVSQATMTWLTVTDYLYHKWPRICCVCRCHNLILSSFMTYHRLCNKSNMTGATSGAGTSILPEHMTSPLIFCEVRAWRSFVFCAMLCKSLFVVFLLVIVLKFFYLRLLFTPVVSLSISW